MTNISTQTDTNENTSTDTSGSASNAATLAGEPSSIAQLQNELSTWKKRYGDSKTYINELNATIKAKEDALLEAKAAKLPSSDEELKALAKEDPKLVNALARMVGEKSLVIQEELNKEITQVKEIQEKLQAEQGFKQVLEAHPDATQIRDSDAFRDWLDLQPADVQDIPFNRSSSPQMIKLLFDNYKQDTSNATQSASQKQATKQKQIDDSKSVTSQNHIVSDGETTGMLYSEAKKKYLTEDGKKPDFQKIRSMLDKGQIVMDS